MMEVNQVFPPLALSIFCRFFGIPFTTHMKKNITYGTMTLHGLSNHTYVV